MLSALVLWCLVLWCLVPAGALSNASTVQNFESHALLPSTATNCKRMQSGQIVFLNEINHTPNLHASSANHAFLVRKGDYVRVSGAVTFLDATNRYCEIEDGSHKLIVDLSVVDIRAHLVSGDICQFIGELRDFREKVFVI